MLIVVYLCPSLPVGVRDLVIGHFILTVASASIVVAPFVLGLDPLAILGDTLEYNNT